MTSADQLQKLLELRTAPIAVSFRPDPPANVSRVSAPGPSGCMPALIEALKDRDARVRAATADALKGIGPTARAAVPELTKALKDPAPEVRSRVARALRAIGPEAAAAIPALGRALGDNKSEQVRAAAGEALKKIDPEAANKAGIH